MVRLCATETSPGGAAGGSAEPVPANALSGTTTASGRSHGETYYHFKHDGINLLEVITSAGSVTKIVHGYTTIDGIGSVVEVEINGTTYFLHQDHRGTTYKITDIYGNVVWQGPTDAWGLPLFETGTNPSIFWYQGQAWWKLVVNGRLFYVSPTRIYDAKDGRFVERDPIRKLPYNAYGFPGSNAVTEQDPMGLGSDILDGDVIQAESSQTGLGTFVGLLLASKYFSRASTGRFGRLLHWLQPATWTTEGLMYATMPGFAQKNTEVRASIASWKKHWVSKYRAKECKGALDIVTRYGIDLERSAAIIIKNAGLSDYVINEARLEPVGTTEFDMNSKGRWWGKIIVEWTLRDLFDVNSFKETVDRAGGFKSSMLNPGNIPGSDLWQTRDNFVSFALYWIEGIGDIGWDKLQGADYWWSTSWKEYYTFPCCDADEGKKGENPWETLKALLPPK
jgi:RHS repeat-associated protein